eukprot:7164187-Ditylum_brightwellii.AAC.1
MSILQQELHKRITLHYLQGNQDIPHFGRFLFNDSLGHLITQPLRHQMQWLDTMASIRLN